MPTLKDALSYAENGWPVFPCIENGKEPATTHGYMDATTDPIKLAEWWGRGNFNIGFCPENAGMCVIDIDRQAFDWPGDYPPPHQVKTPRGTHSYYDGSLPSTASKIAPHIDTRGQGGYVIIPPSVVNGISYEWNTDQPKGAWELPEVPGWIVEKLSNVVPIRKSVITETDRPAAIKAFKRYLEKHPIPPEGEGSDDAVYRTICRGRDLGLSDAFIMECLHTTNFDAEWIEGKLTNVETYAQNEPGCDTPLTGAEAFGGFAANVSSQRVKERAVAAEAGDWTPHDPRDPRDMPELKFFDADNCIPDQPHGAVGIIYGKRGDHKTNTVLSMLAGTEAKRILYAAGEGAFGVEKDRLSARSNLSLRVKLLPRVPLFSSPEQCQAFINGTDSLNWKPQIVVLDTMATALAGEDENSSVTASYLTDNGPCGMFKRAWGCTVILIAHAGKDSSRGVRGSSGFEGNVDFVIEVKADKKNCVIECYVAKMRDAPDGFSIYWQYEAVGVPVPKRISEAEYFKIVAQQEDKKDLIGMVVTSYLRLNGHHDWLRGIEAPDLARELASQEHGARPEDVDAAAEWDTAKEKWYEKLRNARAKSDWGKRSTDSKVFPGGNKMVVRWFSAPDIEF